MIALQILTSISSMVVQNCVYNVVCKKELPTNDHISRFNMITYFLCAILFGIGIIGGSISPYTVLLGLLYGAVTALAIAYKMLSLSAGPLNITLLITSSSMIIPTMSGVFFGEEFSLAKLIAVIVLIFFIYLSLGRGGDGKINKKWIIYCLLCFITSGAGGVIQKIHQSSAFKGETNGFLLAAFACSIVYSRIRSKKTFKELKFTKKHVLFALVCGLCTYAMNVINLRLTGLLPSQLFFPLVNGSAIFLGFLTSWLVFKERLSKRQIIGICGGFLSLLAVCVVK